ncbi:fumarate reductase [Bacteroidia bacterium]|nr:fumarate reductase [Bacteroidia bacterium]
MFTRITNWAADWAAKFLPSSIVKKVVMSLSGAFLVIFLLVHLSVNLSAIASEQAYNTACEFMDTNILIQIMVPILALGFVVHIAMALWITLSNLRARPIKYAASNHTKASTWASRNMFVLGLIVLGFLAVHLSHFWAKMQLAHFLGGHSTENPYLLVRTTLENPVWAIVYLVWITALWFHLCHGFWSMFQSLGVNNSKWIPRLQCIAKIFATVVALGFAVVVLWFALGFAPQQPSLPVIIIEQFIPPVDTIISLVQ